MTNQINLTEKQFNKAIELGFYEVLEIITETQKKVLHIKACLRTETIIVNIH